MSGYLQRLVNTGAGRADSVHPRTGSVFSPRAAEVAIPGAVAEEPDAMAIAPPRARGPVPPLPLDRAETAPTPVADSPYVPLVSNPVAPRHSTETNSPSSRAAPGPSVPSTAAPDDSRADASRRRATPIHPIDEGTPIARSDRHAFRPVAGPKIVVESRRHSAPSVDRPHEWRGGHVDRRPDDIQIHIGRIEVTAVTPPAPRPSKIPDRTPSLDEYLNRGHGRAR
jgi:hypothetical protein